MVARQPILSVEHALSQHRQRPGASAFEPSTLARLLARARAGALDAALIAGADPAGSLLLAARARQLTSPRRRAALAEAISRLHAHAQAPASRCRVRLCRAAVAANFDGLQELAVLLRADVPLYARGLAALEELLSDGTGPLYHGDAAALSRRLLATRAALSGT
jgi:hypothetical protein